jgi:Uma2 family endonuclease
MPVALEEYLHTSYEPDMEYVRGRLVDRHVGEPRHGLIQALIGAALRSRERRLRAFLSLRVRIGNEPIYRVPDICARSLPYDRNAFVPDLVIEVLSPEDEPNEFLLKLADYTRAGIPYIWIVDPYRRTVMEVVHGTLRCPQSLVLSTPLVGEMDFAALFAELDEPAQ